MSERTDFRTRLADALAQSWPATARSSQRLPPGDWSIWLVQAGRGFGKTRVLSETVNAWASSGEHSRIALVAATAADARDVLVEGESGILATAPDWCRPIYMPTRRQLRWPNDVIAHTYSAEEPERLRGPQHSAAVCGIDGRIRRSRVRYHSSPKSRSKRKIRIRKRIKRKRASRMASYS